MIHQTFEARNLFFRVPVTDHLNSPAFVARSPVSFLRSRMSSRGGFAPRGRGGFGGGGDRGGRGGFGAPRGGRGGFGDRGGRGGGRGGSRGRGAPRGGRGGARGGGAKVVIEPHRHTGIFIARGKEDVLVTKNLNPGKAVYGEKLVKVDVRLWTGRAGRGERERCKQ